MKVLKGDKERLKKFVSHILNVSTYHYFEKYIPPII